MRSTQCHASLLGQAEVVEAGPLVVDHRARQVRVGEVAVRLSGREFELAARLASDPRRVFTKTELLRDVWGIRTNGIRTRTVDSHASRLRRKLEAAGAADVVVKRLGSCWWGGGGRPEVAGSGSTPRFPGIVPLVQAEPFRDVWGLCGDSDTRSSERMRACIYSTTPCSRRTFASAAVTLSVSPPWWAPQTPVPCRFPESRPILSP